MTKDYAGQVVVNVIALRARSFEALPSIFACCEPNPCADFDEIEMVLLTIHAQQMFERNRQVIDRLLSIKESSLTGEDVNALSWLSSAAEHLASRIESLRESGQLWVPDAVKRELVPFEGECPF